MVLYTLLQDRLKCVEAVSTILKHEDKMVPVPYIHLLAPRIIDHLNSSAAVKSSKLTKTLIVSEMDCLERLVSFAEESRRKYANIIQISVISYFMLFVVKTLSKHAFVSIQFQGDSTI